MKRAIIAIDENRCTGCGQCVPGCPEGALQIIDGKARLVSDLFCDGLGACIGECPEGAIKVTEREAEPYDEAKVMDTIIAAGPNTISAHLEHLRAHGADEYYALACRILQTRGIALPVSSSDLNTGSSAGCPGAATQSPDCCACAPDSTKATTSVSRLTHWPVQLQLINPSAACFDDADLLITADCVPFALADFHERFLKGKVVVVFCPKLDQTIEQYLHKLMLIFRNHPVKSVTVVRMEVPCCGGTERIVRRALEMAGRTLPVNVQIISIKGGRL